MLYYDVKESGKRMKELRRACGHTQETMSEALGISLDGYKQIERGRNVWIDFWRCLIHLKCTRRGAACIKDITGEYIMDKKFEIGNKIREIRIMFQFWNFHIEVISVQLIFTRLRMGMMA